MSKTLKTTTKYVGIGAALLIGISTAAANSPRSNADQVENVTLSQLGINVHVQLRNKSANKHVDQIQIEPDSSTMNLPLKGFVKCHKNKSTDFTVGRVYFGTVQRQGQNVQPVNSLYNEKYHPTFAEWTGLLGGWISEGGNAEPFVVPLDKVKNGHPAIRFDPVALFNDKLQAHVNGGGSKLEFLKKDQYITVNRPISLSGTCREAISYSQSVSGSGYATLSLPLTIAYKGDPNLFSGVGAGNMSNDLAAPFQVTSAKVTPFVKDYVGQCPVDLKFRVAVNAQGTGDVKFRMVSEQGAKGPVKTLQFDKNDNGVRVFDFIRAIEEAKQGGFNNTKLANPVPKQGNINQYANTPMTKKSGSWKVELVEPKSMTSAESFYSWKCEAAKGPSQIKAATPTPTDPKRAAPKPVVPGKLILKTN